MPIEYRLTSDFPLNAHRVAGMVYTRLMNDPSLLDLVPGGYFEKIRGENLLLECGFRINLKGGSIEVIVDKDQPKTGREYWTRFRVKVGEGGSLDLTRLDGVIRNVQLVLGSAPREGHA